MNLLDKRKPAPYTSCNRGRSVLLFCGMLAIAVALTAGSPARGDEWVCAAWEKNENCSVFYNEKIKRTKNRVNVWTRKIITEELREMDKEVANDISHAEYLESYDCLNATCRILSLITYRKDGDSHQIDFPKSRDTGIVPGSTNESVFEIVCQRDRKTTKAKPKSKIKTKTKGKKKAK